MDWSLPLEVLSGSQIAKPARYFRPVIFFGWDDALPFLRRRKEGGIINIPKSVRM